MQAARWLAICLTLALTEAQDDSEFLMPGVRVLQSRPKRQQSAAIIFPDSPFAPPRFPLHGPGRFAPLPLGPPNVIRPDVISADGPDEALDLPEDLDLNGLDRGSLSRVNSIDKISDFADLFGIQLPLDEKVDSLIQLGPRSGNAIETAELATMATCKPELKTVPLDLPHEPNTLFYPTCVRIEQCGGCCYGPLLTCRPKVTKVVKHKVLRTVVSRSGTTNAVRKPNSRRQRRRRRRRRESIPSYYEVEAIKHVQCECGCKVQAQHCNPAIHNYLERDCDCVCKSQDEKAKCEQQDTKYWDNDSCACYCRRSVNCGTGEFFSQTSCMCEQLSARRGFPVDGFEDRIERRRPFEPPHRRRPVRIPLQPDQPASSHRPTLLTMLHAPRHEIPF